MAKAVEDTAFYRYSRLIAANEVGGSPARFGVALRDFHRDSEERARSWPLAMITTATHDTKRGEDAGARIAVLSEMPEHWGAAVGRWRELANATRTLLDEQPAPAPELEYLFYQALVGVCPFGANAEQVVELAPRLSDYMLKAAREAKAETSWLTPNPEYERAVTGFVRKLLENRAFVADVVAFCAELDAPAVTNALGQTLLRNCCPGIPDIYQGSELWNQSLVDPDNRRPVDYELRRAYLTELGAQPSSLALATQLLRDYRDGRIKQYVLQRALQVRKQKPELFAQGTYTALDGGEHVVAFMRCFENQRLVCVVPRLSHKLGGGRTAFPTGKIWGQQVLSGALPGKYRNVLTGELMSLDDSPRVAELLADFPLALLVQEEA